MRLTAKDCERIHRLLSGYEKQPEVQLMKRYLQHGKTNTYEHCMNVVRLSYWLNQRLHLKADERALLIGALLHDFYLYDWHEKDSHPRLHGFHHPFRACRNAERVFGISGLEAGIIESHMWPLTFRHVPKSREAVIVCVADKWCSIMETIGA